jgi:hypothetical protein
MGDMEASSLAGVLEQSRRAGDEGLTRKLSEMTPLAMAEAKKRSR